MALCESCRPPRMEECTRGHGERACSACGLGFVGGCTELRDLLELAKRVAPLESENARLKRYARLADAAVDELEREINQ